MALSSEELAAIIESVTAAVEGKVTAAVATATTPQPQTNEEPQNQPENQPDYYVHLADGSVITSKDSQSTHMESPETHEAVMVIGRFPKGA